MNTFISTFPSGLQAVAEDYIVNNLEDSAVNLVLDGLIEYETPNSPSDINKIRLFSNSFIVINKYKKEILIKDMVTGLSLPKPKNDLREFLTNHKSFRIVISEENKFIKIDNILLKRTEKNVSNTTNLIVDRGNPDIEFWFIKRSEGHGYFAARITKHPDWAKVLAKGQLRPEITQAICLLSEPKDTDIVLDPFAGSGTLVKERSTYFKFSNVYASDTDISMLEDFKQNNVYVDKADALSLKYLESNSIDKIITDPPWGYFSKIENITTFYAGMLKSFSRVLKPGGTIVILVGPKEEFESILASQKDKFGLIVKYDILVSGKKAAIYYLKKL